MIRTGEVGDGSSLKEDMMVYNVEEKAFLSASKIKGWT